MLPCTGTFSLCRWGETPEDFEERGPYPIQSFTRQFLEVLFSDMSNVAQATRDIYNLSRTLDTLDSNFSFMSLGHAGFDCLDDMIALQLNASNYEVPGGQPLAAAGSSAPISSSVGIVVGTSSTAVGASDYRMEGHITHGTGGNQLIHYGTWGYNHTVANGTASFVVERVWRQDSNGSVVVNEMGIYAIAPVEQSQVSSFCIVRDVLGSTITIASGQFLRATYTFQVSE